MVMVPKHTFGTLQGCSTRICEMAQVRQLSRGPRSPLTGTATPSATMAGLLRGATRYAAAAVAASSQP